jgi:hypothetical protein
MTTSLCAGALQIARVLLLSLLVFPLAGCVAKAWGTHPMPRPPDRSCRTGGGVGHDVWIWHCIDGKHVVVSQYCGGFVGCSEAEREEAACGEETPLETSLRYYLDDRCRPVPEGQRWPTR